MARGRFHKMHGLGNDFVIVDGREVRTEITPARAAQLADRKTGIGCDQLILLEASTVADVKMRIFNQDGSEAEACGNATRCVVSLLGHDVRIETAGGVLTGQFGEKEISITLPLPRFEWQDIPLAFAMDSGAMPMAWGELETPMAVNVGNPHVVFFVADAGGVDLADLGPAIEHDPVFPDRVNVNVATVDGKAISLRVWERGVGETRACGTGACATAVAAIRSGKVQSPVTVRQAGGDLTIGWQPGGSIEMRGGATYVFSGEIDWEAFG
jgi:diaminopimelate epimerase